VLNGSFTITNSNDVNTLACYTAVTGDVDIDAPGLGGIVLPNLVSIGGSLQMTGNGDINLGEINLPVLTSVGHNINFPPQQAISLQVVLLPALTTIGSTFSIDEAPIASLSLPSLTTCPDNFVLGGSSFMQGLSAVSAPLLKTTSILTINVSNAPVTSIDMPAMASAGTFSASLNPGTINFGALTTLGSLSVGSTVGGTMPFAALTSVTGGVVFAGLALSAPLLKTIGGTLGLAGTGFNLPVLASVANLTTGGTFTTLELPALTTATSVDFASELPHNQCSALYGNLHLTTINIPLLTTATAVSFGYDPALPMCRAQAFVAQMNPTVTATYQCTLATGPCP
jgi:hypothetical protein